MTKGLTGQGINAQREMFSPVASITEEINDYRASGGFPNWFRAVIVDVIFDPLALGDERKELLGQILNNPELLPDIPQNSILARIISNKQDIRQTAFAIFYPMDSHVQKPVKPGEHVWVMFENPERNMRQGFWYSRIVEPRTVEDFNFTHADRKFTVDLTQDTSDMFEGTTENAGGLPGFPNGADTEETFTLVGEDDYEVINDEALATKIFTPEPVPRFNKRPADLALFGSNNAMLVLGEDRTGPAARVAAGEVTGRPLDDQTGFAGTADLVVGRGREVSIAPGISTAPHVIQNTRGNLETDKQLDNPNEGDPDFSKDSARLYLSMNTNGDKNFSLEGNLPNLNGQQQVPPVPGAAYAVLKSDEIRIIGRKDELTGINGSIKIVKEGATDDDRAVIMMQPDGTIMIDGPRIIIGSGIEKGNGAGNQVFLGRDASESIVLGDTLKSLLDEYTTATNTNIAAFADTLTNTISVPPGNLGNFGLPVPGLIAISAAANALKAAQQVSTKKFQAQAATFLSKNGKTK